MTLSELQAVLRENGIVGAGGAGFPTYAKLSDKADTLILNCAECEPLLRLHRQVLEKYNSEIISTLDLISKTIGAKAVYIGIKGSYTRAVEAVKAEIGNYENIEICTLPEVYPAGDEVVLTYEATGRIVPAGDIPLSVGVTVLNVETVLNIYKALSGEPVTHKYVTVTGEVKNPITVLAPIGAPLSDLIKMAGGITVSNPAYIIGGPMMGSLGSASQPVTKTTNAVLVLPDDIPLVQKKLANPTIDMKRAMAACCQCNYCSSLCPRNLLGHPIDPSKFMLAASNHLTNDAAPYVNSLYCSGCGLCEMYSCGQGLSPRSLLAVTKGVVRGAGIRPEIQKNSKAKNERPYRMIPLSRLRARLGLNPYNKSAPIVDAKPSPKKLNILLSQHIGAPAQATVLKGDYVSAGQRIAISPDKALGVAIHAPLGGIVSDINDKKITISVQ